MRYTSFTETKMNNGPAEPAVKPKTTSHRAVKSLKGKRSNAKRAHTNAVSHIHRLIDAKTNPERVIKEDQALTVLTQRVNDAHMEYVAALGLDPAASAVEDGYILQVEDTAKGCHRRVEKYIQGYGRRRQEGSMPPHRGLPQPCTGERPASRGALSEGTRPRNAAPIVEHKGPSNIHARNSSPAARVRPPESSDGWVTYHTSGGVMERSYHSHFDPRDEDRTARSCGPPGDGWETEASTRLQRQVSTAAEKLVAAASRAAEIATANRRGDEEERRRLDAERTIQELKDQITRLELATGSSRTSSSRSSPHRESSPPSYHTSISNGTYAKSSFSYEYILGDERSSRRASASYAQSCVKSHYSYDYIFEDDLSSISRESRRRSRHGPAGDVPPQRTHRSSGTSSADAWIDRRSWGRDMADGRAGANFAPWMFAMLPKPDIPKFDGDPRQWFDFITTFKTLIHDTVPSDALRLAHLRNYLGPRAKAAVGMIINDPTQYLRVMARLKQRYGNPQVIIHAQLRALTDIKPCRTESLGDLVEFWNEVKQCLNTFEASGDEADIRAGSNVLQLVQKLPKGIQSRWGRYVKRLRPTYPTLRHLDAFLEDHIEGEELGRPEEFLSRVPRAETRPRRTEEYRGARAIREPTIRAVTIDDGASDGPPIVPREPCFVCKSSDHGAPTCDEFVKLEPKDRAVLTLASGFCFRCLVGRHRGAECPNFKGCQVDGCRIRHHTLIHGSPRVSNPRTADTTISCAY